MTVNLMWKRTLGLFILAAFVAAIQTGCADRKTGKPKIKRMEGVAEKIDLTSNSVSMKVVGTDGRERVLDGTFREDTTVTINGRDDKLEHVKPGDKVVVFGYREGEGEQVKLIATRVEVSRPEGSDWKSTGKAAEKPVENKQAPTAEKPAGPTTAPAAGTSETKKPG